MPVQIDLKPREKEEKKKEAVEVENIQNDRPPFSALTHVKIENVEFGE
jgi:hypothetical protein